jgi:hypothetical protein
MGTVTLARLAAREYVETTPLGAALAALMGRENVPDPLELRARMLNRVATSDLDEFGNGCSSMSSRRTSGSPRRSSGASND